MNITKTKEDTKLTLALEGRLDSVTASQLEAEITHGLAGVKELVLDFSKLVYLSSAGLRVILSAQKIMNRQGKMVLHHVNETTLELFTATGFLRFLTIE